MNFCPIFYIFQPIWMKLGTRDVHSNLSIDHAIYKIKALKAILYMGEANEFQSVFSTLLSNSVEIQYKDLHIMLFSICKLHQYWHRDGHIFLMGVKGITSHTCYQILQLFGSKKCLGNVCVSCHEVHHMQPCSCM